MIKLDKNSVFKTQSIVAIRNKEIFFNELVDAAASDRWPDCLDDEDWEQEDSWGSLIFHSGTMDIHGTIIFLIYYDDVKPIVKIGNKYVVVPDYDKDQDKDMLSDEQIRLIEEGVDFLNKVVVEGGRMDFSWYTR